MIALDERALACVIRRLEAIGSLMEGQAGLKHRLGEVAADLRRQAGFTDEDVARLSAHR